MHAYGKNDIGNYTNYINSFVHQSSAASSSDTQYPSQPPCLAGRAAPQPTPLRDMEERTHGRAARRIPLTYVKGPNCDRRTALSMLHVSCRVCTLSHAHPCVPPPMGKCREPPCPPLHPCTSTEPNTPERGRPPAVPARPAPRKTSTQAPCTAVS